MRLLDAYLDKIEHSPRDDVWYYIQFGTYGYYLKRDKFRSPKKSV